MATQIAGLNYYELDFNADGTLSSDGGLPAAAYGMCWAANWNNDDGRVRLGA